MGDANLDGRVDVSDFNLWNNNKFQTGTWSSGDFTCDGVVDVSDFNVWNNNNFTIADELAAFTGADPIDWTVNDGMRDESQEARRNQRSDELKFVL